MSGLQKKKKRKKKPKLIDTENRLVITRACGWGMYRWMKMVERKNLSSESLQLSLDRSATAVAPTR